MVGAAFLRSSKTYECGPCTNSDVKPQPRAPKKQGCVAADSSLRLRSLLRLRGPGQTRGRCRRWPWPSHGGSGSASPLEESSHGRREGLGVKAALASIPCCPVRHARGTAPSLPPATLARDGGASQGGGPWSSLPAGSPLSLSPLLMGAWRGAGKGALAQWCQVVLAAGEAQVEVTRCRVGVFVHALLKPRIGFAHNGAPLSAWALPAIWGVFFWLVFARTLTIPKCSRSVLCVSYCSRMHPGAVISSGNPPPVWKIQHMHMDILIKGKKT